MKVHRFLVGLDPKINTFVNILSPKTLEEAYDLAKREESNLSLKRTFVDYKHQDGKDKEAYKKNKDAKLQRQQSNNNKSKDNYQFHQFNNSSKFGKKTFGNKKKYFQKKNQ